MPSEPGALLSQPYWFRQLGKGAYTMRPYGGGTIVPWQESEPGPSGHTGRPYEKTESVA